MPGHFTHIYEARRVADWLAEQTSFNADDSPDEGWTPLHGGLDGLNVERAAQVMADWPKYTDLGAIGPDIFFFCQDYSSGPLAAAPFEDDTLMLAMAIYYWIDAAKEEDWEPLLILLAEVDQTFARIVRLLIKLQKLWQAFVDGWNATIGPFVDAAGAILDGLTGGILSQAAVVFQELFDGLKQIVEEELLTFKDIFSWFALKMRQGWDEKSFVWSDMLHYRKTNEMARNLLLEAKRQFDLNGDADQFAQFQAFALGWICHVGTDVIGHSFVNEQCGGPFRTHWQRHHLVENHIDALNYRQAGPGGTITTDPIGAADSYPDIGQSALAFAVALDPADPNGKERPATVPADPAAAKKAVDVDGELPDWLADGIVRAMIATYHDGGPEPANLGGGPFQSGINTVFSTLEQLLTDAGIEINVPLSQAVQQVAPTPTFQVPSGYPLPWEVKTTYKFMLTYYKLSFWTGFDLAKPRRPDVIIWPPASDFTDLASAPDLSGVSSGDPIEDVCDAILAILEWFGKEIAAALKLIGDLIKAVTSPFTYPIRYGLYQLAMYFWDMVTTAHEILAHTGFVLPHGERRYADNGELMLPNEIDNGLVSLGSSTDAAFVQALKDATDPFGNLDKDPSLIDPPHNPRTTDYPYLPVRDKQVADIDPSFFADHHTNEYRRPWAYPDHSRDTNGNLYPTPTEVSDIRAELDFAGASKDLGAIMREGVLPRAGPVSGPFPAGSTPDQVLFRTGRQVSPSERSQYEVALTPAHTDALNELFIGHSSDIDHSPLGDPIQFCSYLMGRILSPDGYDIDFNLDADRGYGYRCWDWIRGKDMGKNGREQPYKLPVVEPEGAAGSPPLAWNGAAPDATQIPIQLHYVGEAPPQPSGNPGAGDNSAQPRSHKVLVNRGATPSRSRKPTSTKKGGR